MIALLPTCRSWFLLICLALLASLSYGQVAEEQPDDPLFSLDPPEQQIDPPDGEGDEDAASDEADTADDALDDEPAIDESLLPAPLPEPTADQLASASPAFSADTVGPPPLAGVPDMFGDTFFGSSALFISASDSHIPALDRAIVDLPYAGGSHRIKISENTKAVPLNRFYFVYNHFRNAFNSSAIGRTASDEFVRTSEDDSLDRYILGWEQTFYDGLCSIELRMPFSGIHTFGFAPPPSDPAGALDVHGGQVGNLAIIVKELIYADACGAYSWGLGVEIPTGSDVTARRNDYRLTIENDTVHLSPYFAALFTPASCWFVNTFVQMDIPTSGNTVQYWNWETRQGGELGKLDEHALLHLDLSVGYWLYQNPSSVLLIGFAPMAEFHYTTTLQDTDIITGTIPGASPDDVMLRHRAGRFDLITVTAALHFELACSTKLRVGGIFPLRDEDLFDTEFGLQITRYF
jgi:hypothetical protein